MSKRMLDVLDELVPERATSGEMIRIFRESIPMTLKELEGLTGIANTHLSALENDKMELSVKNAKKIAAALGIRPQDLLFPNGLYEKGPDILKIEKKFEKFIQKKKKAS